MSALHASFRVVLFTPPMLPTSLVLLYCRRCLPHHPAHWVGLIDGAGAARGTGDGTPPQSIVRDQQLPGEWYPGSLHLFRQRRERLFLHSRTVVRVAARKHPRVPTAVVVVIAVTVERRPSVARVSYSRRGRKALVEITLHLGPEKMNGRAVSRGVCFVQRGDPERSDGKSERRGET